MSIEIICREHPEVRGAISYALSNTKAKHIGYNKAKQILDRCILTPDEYNICQRKLADIFGI